MAIEIVDFPIKNGGSFHSFLYVYQRVHLDTYRIISRYGCSNGCGPDPDPRQAEEIAQELESKAPWVGTQGYDGPWAR